MNEQRMIRQVVGATFNQAMVVKQPPVITPTIGGKERSRVELISATERFLASGGKIQKIPTNKSGLSAETKAQLRAANRPERDVA